MRITRREAEDALELPNVQAFLRVIRQGESSQADVAYRLRYHPTRRTFFDDLSRHPRIFEDTPDGRRSSAAGAYQITATTWSDIAPQLGLTDFSRRSQDIAAVALMARRGALEDVLAGRIEDAIGKCRQEWTSLPGAAENRAGWTLTAALDLYRLRGGEFMAGAPMTQPAAPIEDRSTPMRAEDRDRIFNPEQETTVPFPLLALITAFGPAIMQMIPQVAKLFVNPEKPKDARTLEAIQIVFDTIQKATGTSNVQAAVDAMRGDLPTRETAVKAVVTEPTIMAVLEIGGGIEKAREANVATIAADKPLWKNPALVITVMLLPLVYAVTFSVLLGSDDPSSYWRGFWGSGFMPETRSATVNLILGMVLGGIMGFFFGTTFGSNRKTDLIAQQSDVKQ